MDDHTQVLQAEVDRLKALMMRSETLLAVLFEMNDSTSADELLLALSRIPIHDGAIATGLSFVDVDVAGYPRALRQAATWSHDRLPTTAQDEVHDLATCTTMATWLRRREPVFIADIQAETDIDPATLAVYQARQARAIVVLPLIQGQRWVGLADACWPTPRDFDPAERESYNRLRSLIVPGVERQRLVDELASMVIARTAELERLLENVGDAIFSTDLDGVIRAWNAAAVQIYGWDVDEALGQNLGVIHPDMDWRADVLVPTLDAGQHSTEYIACRKNGTRLAVRLKTTLVRDDAGTPTAVVGIAADISESRRMAQEREAFQRQIIATQQQAIRDLSSPIIPILNGIIVMPLIGQIDSQRARDIMQALLAGVSQHRARVVIIDITGVANVDTAVAEYLNRTVKAAALKGAQAIITGISPAVAETIVSMGIDWRHLDTLRDLQTGLLAALKHVDYQLVRRPDPLEGE